MKNLLKIAAVAGLFLGSFAVAGAVSTFTVPQGGSGQNTFTSSQLLYGAGTNPIQSVATSSWSVASPLTTAGTIGALVGGSGFSVGCQTASGSQPGCLSAADWTIFNSKESVLSFVWPLIRSVNSISFGGLSSSSPWTTGNLAYVTSGNTVSSVATTTASCSGSTSCTAFTVIGSSPITISSAGGSGAPYPFQVAGNATTTLTQFNGGLTAYASSTIGNGTLGLTVNGPATTSVLYVTATATSTFAGGIQAVTSYFSGLVQFASNVLNAAGGYINFGTLTGTSGYGFWDNAGKIFSKDSGGTWAPVSGDIYLTGGINLRNAKYVSASSTAPVANTYQTIYTAPLDKRALVYGAAYANFTAGSIINRLYYLNSGTYYGIIASTTIGANAQGSAQTSFILEPGESIALLSNTTGGTATWVQILEYDSGVPVYTAKVLNPTTATTTLYTVPASVSAGCATLTMFSYSSNATCASLFNFAGGTNSGKFFLLKSGQTASDAVNRTTAIAATLTVSSGIGNISILGNTFGAPAALNSGDSIQYSIAAAPGTPSIIWLNTIEH